MKNIKTYTFEASKGMGNETVTINVNDISAIEQEAGYLELTRLTLNTKDPQGNNKFYLIPKHFSIIDKDVNAILQRGEQ